MNSYTKKPEVQNKTTLYGEMNRVIKGGGDTDRYPRSVQVFSSDKQKTKSSGFIHPTQKPVGLLEYLIKTYTNESEVVLDNAAGSSSTAIACLNTNRNWIMMENDESYYELSLKRIESQKKLLSL
jgi:site-specific DNA-methyltransferase (adenine-specific)